MPQTARTTAALEISSLSREYVRCEVRASANGVQVDPTVDIVEFAAVTVGTEPSSWTAGGWETVPGPIYFARIMVGGLGSSATLALADGLYDVWVRVTDSPEKPAWRVGRIRIT